MNPAVFLVGLVLAAMPAGAATIDMNVGDQESEEPEDFLIGPEVIRLLNDDPYVHLFIDGYDRVGVRFGGDEYTVHVENDSIVGIVPGIRDADYVVEMGFEELLYLYANRDSYSRVELLRLALLEKDIPLRVVMRFAGVLLKNG